MSRIATGSKVTVAPQNNVYTILVVLATLVNLLGFWIILSRYWQVFGTKASMFQQ